MKPEFYEAQSRVRDAVRRRQPILGSWLQTGSVAVAEILANAGFAWLGLDCEHTSSDLATVESIARALYGRNTALLVRVSRCDVLEIRKSLDVGASGVIVPLVETAEQARIAVAAAKYPPVGRRGFCFGRMNDWGVRFDEYAASANDLTVVLAMIETRAGVDAIGEILQTDGLDGVFIGSYDLSGSYGVPGQLQHPAVRDARRRILEACREAGKTAGQHIVHSDSVQVQEALAAGFTFICLDADIVFLNRAARQALSLSLPDRL
jgi:2-keto-3-deoxy-L-rhamnonate aldolase RhmA